MSFACTEKFIFRSSYHFFCFTKKVVDLVNLETLITSIMIKNMLEYGER